MIDFRRIALTYKYSLSNEMCERILASIDIYGMGYTMDELYFLNRLNIPVFEYYIRTPKDLNTHLIKVGKSVYLDYLTNRVYKQWQSLTKCFKTKENGTTN